MDPAVYFESDPRCGNPYQPSLLTTSNPSIILVKYKYATGWVVSWVTHLRLRQIDPLQGIHLNLVSPELFPFTQPSPDVFVDGLNFRPGLGNHNRGLPHRGSLSKSKEGSIDCRIRRSVA